MGSYSSSSTSSDSLNGLKFGQKIYFEDVGVGGVSSSVGNNTNKSGGSGGGDVTPASPAKKGRFGGGGGQGGQQPPRCQVEGCKVDLSDAKGYYARHKVCVMHSKSAKVVVSGLEQRFCQQCSRSVCLALLDYFQVIVLLFICIIFCVYSAPTYFQFCFFNCVCCWVLVSCLLILVGLFVAFIVAFDWLMFMLDTCNRLVYVFADVLVCNTSF